MVAPAPTKADGAGALVLLYFLAMLVYGGGQAIRIAGFTVPYGHLHATMGVAIVLTGCGLLIESLYLSFSRVE